jgi:hypothetical protein
MLKAFFAKVHITIHVKLGAFSLIGIVSAGQTDIASFETIAASATIASITRVITEIIFIKSNFIFIYVNKLFWS